MITKIRLETDRPQTKEKTKVQLKMTDINMFADFTFFLLLA